jgi:hypothetical protein
MRRSKYSEEFKRFICNEYLNGSSTRRELVAKYKIGNSRLTYCLISISFSQSNFCTNFENLVQFGQ